MTVTIYSEISICRDTGAAGWSGVIHGEGRPDLRVSGVMQGQPLGGVLHAELEGVRMALSAALHRSLIAFDDDVVFALRSTAPMAVLRWTFEDARCDGLPMTQPKRIKPATRDLEALQAIREDVARMGMRLTLRRVGQNSFSHWAHNGAREAMERVRS